MGRKRKIFDMKQYQRDYGKKYRKEHPDKNSKSAKKKKEIILKIKSEGKCFICGYKEHTEILEFHHLRDKISDISRMRNGKKLIKEIEKCILICPNCHRWLHWKEILSSKEKFK